MGVIARQAIKSSIYSYLGVIIGFITVGWLMPKYLSTGEIGVIRQVQYYSMFLASIFAFGIPPTIIRMRPKFISDDKKNHGFINLITLLALFSSVVFALLFYNYAPSFLEEDFQKSVLFKQFHGYILWYTIALILFTTYDAYATSLRESTIGVFLKDFVLRVFLIILIGLYILLDHFTFADLIATISQVQFIPTVLLLAFLISKKAIPFSSQLSFPSASLRTEFTSASTFNWVNGLSAVAVVSIDSIMLSKYVNSEAVGIYTTLNFFAALMLIPNKNLGKIANSIIAEHFKSDKLIEIKSIYTKSAFLPFVLGLFLFINLLFTTPIIFNFFLKPEYLIGFWALIFLAISNLFKMGTGVKFSLIFNSQYYRWSTLMFMGFVGLLVWSNLIFIPKYGISGAALASLISTTLFHVAGLIFVSWKFKYSPFDSRFLKVGLVAGVLGTAIYFIPSFLPEEGMSIIKSILFSIPFFLYIYKSKVSEDINQQIDNLLRLIKN